MLRTWSPHLVCSRRSPNRPVRPRQSNANVVPPSGTIVSGRLKHPFNTKLSMPCAWFLSRAPAPLFHLSVSVSPGSTSHQGDETEASIRPTPVHPFARRQPDGPVRRGDQIVLHMPAGCRTVTRWSRSQKGRRRSTAKMCHKYVRPNSNPPLLQRSFHLYCSRP